MINPANAISPPTVASHNTTLASYRLVITHCRINFNWLQTVT